jgi:hypothetical protein
LTFYSFSGADAQGQELAPSGRSRPVVVALPHSTSGSAISRPSSHAGFNASSQKKRSQASLGTNTNGVEHVAWGSIQQFAAHPQTTASILNASGLSPPLFSSLS